MHVFINISINTTVIVIVIILLLLICLQYFDTVGWALGRESGL